MANNIIERKKKQEVIVIMKENKLKSLVEKEIKNKVITTGEKSL